MSDEHGNNGDGARLWARARPGWGAATASEAAKETPDSLMLAAYLDDTLDPAGRAAVEAWVASTPEALELMIAVRAELGQTPDAAPESLVSRAQGLVRAPVRESAGLGAWLRGLIGFGSDAWRPMAWVGVAAAMLLVSAGGFELGRLGAAQLAPVQTATLGDDLELGLDDPADDLI